MCKVLLRYFWLNQVFLVCSYYLRVMGLSEQPCDFLFRVSELWDANETLSAPAFLKLQGLYPADFKTFESKVAATQEEYHFFFPKTKPPFGDSNENLSPSCRDFRGIFEKGLLSCRFKFDTIQKRADTLQKDKTLIIVMATDYVPLARRSLLTKSPVFIGYFLSSTWKMSFGYYFVAEEMPRRSTFKLLPCEDQWGARAQLEVLLGCKIPGVQCTRRVRSRSPRRSTSAATLPCNHEVSAILATNPSIRNLSVLERLHLSILSGMNFRHEVISEKFPLDDDIMHLEGCRHHPAPFARIWIRLKTRTEDQSEVEMVLACTPTPPTYVARRNFHDISRLYGPTILCISGSYESAVEEPTTDVFQAKLWTHPLHSEEEEQEFHTGLVWRRDVKGFYLGNEGSRPCSKELDNVFTIYRSAVAQNSSRDILV